MKELRASMDTIRKTSADMIGQIEEKLKELQIERPEQEVIAVEQTEELSAMQYAEQTINRLEQERTIFSNDQRNLIANFAYKLDDREATEKLAENLAESILDGNREEVLKLIEEAEEQIDSLPDSMIGLSELHEAGFYSESMLPLTRNGQWNCTMRSNSLRADRSSEWSGTVTEGYESGTGYFTA